MSVHADRFQIRLSEPLGYEDMDTGVWRFMPRILDDIRQLGAALDHLAAQIGIQDDPQCWACLHAYKLYLEAKLALIGMGDAWNTYAQHINHPAEGPLPFSGHQPIEPHAP